jgi:hypothetical protein
MRLRKVCNHPSLVLENKENGEPSVQLPAELVKINFTDFYVKTSILTNKRDNKNSETFHQKTVQIADRITNALLYTNKQSK